MSTQLLFPYIRPLDDPPPRENSIHRGHRVPCYALAWKCRGGKYNMRITEANMGLNMSNVREKAITRWLKEFDFPTAQKPSVWLGADGYFYLIAMFNGREFPDYATRAMNPDDPLIVAARQILFVTDELQPTFKWYRYPMNWAVSDHAAHEENQ